MCAPAVAPLARALALGLAGALCACGAARHDRGAIPPGPAAGGGTWSYEVAIGDDPDGLALAVDARFPADAPRVISVTEGAEPFVDAPVVDVTGEGTSWRPLERHADSWMLPACGPRGCRLRYRFRARDAGESIDSDDVASAYHGVVEAPLGTWLMHPLEAHDADRFRVHVQVRAGATAAFATSIPRARDGAADTWEAAAHDISAAPYTVFGRVRLHEIALAHATLVLGVAPGKLAVDDARLSAWIERAGRAVEAFYGVFPLDHALVVALPTRGDGVGYGRTMAGAGGGSILINVGRDADDDALASDWVAVHEMIHLAFPSVPHEHVWMEEGLATYLEPIVRARAGMIAEDDVWQELVTMLPNGLPAAGDRGLDRTRTWGRVYWGGALYCMLADLEIRKRTNGARGLPDAVRGILAAGGNDAARWDLSRALDAGDAATGVPVLRELHARMGSAPMPVDLEAIWRDLGVTVRGRSVRYDERAPLAAIRRVMASGSSGGAAQPQQAQGMLDPRP